MNRLKQIVLSASLLILVNCGGQPTKSVVAKIQLPAPISPDMVLTNEELICVSDITSDKIWNLQVRICTLVDVILKTHNPRPKHSCDAVVEFIESERLLNK